MGSEAKYEKECKESQGFYIQLTNSYSKAIENDKTLGLVGESMLKKAFSTTPKP